MKYFFNKLEVIVIVIGWFDVIVTSSILNRKNVPPRDLVCYNNPEEPTKMQDTYWAWLIVDSIFFSSRCLRLIQLAQVKPYCM